MSEPVLTQRKEFFVRDNEILLRWIVEGPAGAIEVYVPVRPSDAGGFDARNAEIHRHAFRPTPESCEALREDCDLMPGQRCYFTAWWGSAAREAWYEVSESSGHGEEAVWEFLRYAYSSEFDTAGAPKPTWLS